MSSAQQTRRRPRADYVRTRTTLLTAAGGLLEEHGTSFTLPDLARRAGVSTATTYRHFDDVHAVFEAYYVTLLDDLVDRFEAVSEDGDALTSFHAVCATWVQGARAWGRAATHIRSPRGYLERLHEGTDPLLGRLDAVLRRCIDRLVADDAVPDVDRDLAVLTWITLFDERVVVDLTIGLGRSTTDVTRSLARSVLHAWS